MSQRTLSPWEQAALYVAEQLAFKGKGGEARTLLVAIDAGQIDEDDESLRVLLAPHGVDLETLYAELDGVLYRDGRRARLPANPCPHALRRFDNTPDPERLRPCLKPEDHDGSCMFADGPLRAQRASTLQFRAEVAMFERAISGAPVH
jgi:hypothetical protein